MPRAQGRLGLSLLLMIAAVMAAPRFASAETISGHILNADGTPVTDDVVCARPVLGPFGPNVPDAVVSDPANGGAYSISVPPGSYMLTFADCPGWRYSPRNDAPTYYGATGTGTYADASPLTVTAGHDVTGLDVRMRPGATLSGHIYGGPGTDTPLASTCLVIHPTAGPGLTSYVSQDWTDVDGSYAFTRLDPEYTYKLKATPCPGPYLTEWYDGGTSLETATPIAVPASGIDIHLDTTVVTPNPAAGDPPADEDPPATDDPATDDPAADDPPRGGDAPSGEGPRTGSSNPAPVGGPSVAPPSATVTAAAPAPAPRATTAIPRAAFGPWRAFRLGTALRSGLRVPVRCAKACSPRVVVTVSAATARRLHVARTLVIGRATLKAGIATTLVVPLPAHVRRALAHERRVTFGVAVTAAGRQLRHTLTLRR